LTMIADDAAAAAAVRAGCDHAEHPAEPRLGDAAGPTALDADSRAGAGLGPGSLAGLAVVLPLELDGFLGPFGNFVQGQFDLGLQIEAAGMGPAAAAAAAAESTDSAENVVEHREDVAHIHVGEI